MCPGFARCAGLYGCEFYSSSGLCSWFIGFRVLGSRVPTGDFNTIAPHTGSCTS